MKRWQNHKSCCTLKEKKMCGSIANVFREHIGNRKNSYFPSQKKEKIGPPGGMLHHLIVVEQSFYSYICLRPFSTYANAKAIQLGDLSIVQNRSPLAPFTIYIHETSTLNKAYGIKVWCYSKPLGNLMGTP